MKRLSHWIHSRVEEGSWKPLKALSGGVKISHLLFADDLILFAEADKDQVDCIKEGLSKFCITSGQKINYDI